MILREKNSSKATSTIFHLLLLLTENKAVFQLHFWINNNTCPECFHVYTELPQITQGI